MKIYILPVSDEFRPHNQPFLYPKYNSDYGVEQDFLCYLLSHPNFLTSNPKEADWHYLPVYWTRYHLNRNRRPEGLVELQTEVDKLIYKDHKTFTVCQFDDGPIVNLGKTLQCLASRKDASVTGIDIPLLASPIIRNLVFPNKRKYRASFVGQFKNHPLRYELYNLLGNRDDIYYSDGDFGLDLFINILLQSWIGLCPRGYGGSSFRLFEVMQLCCVPLIIGDVDPRPFKNYLNWEDFSFYIKDHGDVMNILELHPNNSLQKMGVLARENYFKINYQNWCSYLLQEIEESYT